MWWFEWDLNIEEIITFTLIKNNIKLVYKYCFVQ